MGIKRKIIIGFISIGTLLFLSGIISSLELIRFNSSTYSIMTDSRKSVENSANMLDAIQNQNTALLMSISDKSGVYDSIFTAESHDFKKSLSRVSSKLSTKEAVAGIVKTYKNYNEVVNNRPPVITLEWFSDIYKTTYYNLTSAIKELLVQTQNSVINQTQELHENAYRASMIGIISLAAGALLMLLFFFLLNNFFISPVLKIHSELKRAITLKVPYKVTLDAQDELKLLSENIANLIEINRKQNS